MLGVGVDVGVGVELEGALAPPAFASVAASAVACTPAAQAVPAISTSSSVYVLAAIRILFDAYGVS
jgi:hypothetical protein